MKKNSCFWFILIVLFSLPLPAQVSYTIHENTYQKISISFSFGKIKPILMNTSEGCFSRIYMEGCGSSRNIGEPELPVFENMLEIPIFGDYELNIYGNNFVIYDLQTLGINFPIYPVQPPVSKSQEGPVDLIQHKKTYQTDNFYALPLAQFEELGIMRNLNLGELCICPVEYNPVTQKIKVYKTLSVEILFKKTELMKTQALQDLHKSPLFHSVPVINPMHPAKADFSETPIKYLIVAHSMFRGALDEFIAWKKRKGFLVEVGYTDESNVGTTTSSIATFIKSHYVDATPENPAPTFVLLVGDVQQIPTFSGTTGSHPTDLYYFTWANGNLPDCYYGRFSAQNVAQLTPQIEKTLQYEQFSMANANYLNDIVLIAGYDAVDAPLYGNGFVNYATHYYANKEYGYSTVYAHYHPCASDAAKIRTEIGGGVGLAIYSAHCDVSGWGNPSFNINHITTMNNANKYGLMIGNCCFSNKFNYSECFGEALLRTPGKGAVGYIGASNNTYWDEDYYWEIGFRSVIDSNPAYNSAFLGALDRLYHTHDEAKEKWMTTFGAMMVAGNEAVQISTSPLKKYYWEIYHLMGDPSITTYLTKPSQMGTLLPDFVSIGANTLTGKVAPYSYCALTNSKRDLIGAGFADATGNITLSFDSVKIAGEYEFSAWAQKYVQYFKTIQVVPQGIDAYSVSCSVYPNPTTGELIVKSDELRVKSVEVYDVYGRKVLEQKAESRKQNTENNSYGLTNDGVVMDFSHLPAGIYFVRVVFEGGSSVKKLVKQ